MDVGKEFASEWFMEFVLNPSKVPYGRDLLMSGGFLMSDIISRKAKMKPGLTCCRRTSHFNLRHKDLTCNVPQLFFFSPNSPLHCKLCIQQCIFLHDPITLKASCRAEWMEILLCPQRCHPKCNIFNSRLLSEHEQGSEYVTLPSCLTSAGLTFHWFPKEKSKKKEKKKSILTFWVCSRQAPPTVFV